MNNHFNNLLHTVENNLQILRLISHDLQFKQLTKKQLKTYGEHIMLLETKLSAATSRCLLFRKSVKP